MDSNASGRISVRHPKFNPKVPIFSQQWLVVGGRSFYYTNPFSLMADIRSFGKESSKNLEIQVSTINPWENILKESLHQLETIICALGHNFSCAGPIQLKRKLTRKELRRNLSGTELEGFENISKMDVDHMSEDECEAKIFKVLEHVLKDIDVVEDQQKSIDTAPSNGIIYLD